MSTESDLYRKRGYRWSTALAWWNLVACCGERVYLIRRRGLKGCHTRRKVKTCEAKAALLQKQKLTESGGVETSKMEFDGDVGMNVKSSLRSYFYTERTNTGDYNEGLTVECASLNLLAVCLVSSLSSHTAITFFSFSPALLFLFFVALLNQRVTSLLTQRFSCDCLLPFTGGLDIGCDTTEERDRAW